jgi:predicted DNA-binding transcriptional regulator YafY
MGLNKNALIRYKAIDNCLRNTGRKYYIEDLVNACNEKLLDLYPESQPVKKRTVQYDLVFMESDAGYGIPLERVSDGQRRKYYKYTNPNFTIQEQPLNDIEAEQLTSALNLLSRIQGIPQQGWLNDIIYKLKDRFSLSDAADSVMSFDSNEFLKGREFLGVLYDLIITKKAALITYQSFKAASHQEIRFHPYFLKQYNNRWFLIGKNDDYESIVSLALDRIIAIQSLSMDCDDTLKIDFEEYFDDVIGITKHDLAIQKIIVKVAPSQVDYIKTKPWHHSFTIINHDPLEFQFSITVIPNYELESLILTFGEHVEVVSPQSLRDQLKSRINSLYHVYNDK